MIPRRLSRAAACLLTLLLSLIAAAGSAQDKSKTLRIEAGYDSLKGKVIYGASHALLIGVNEYPHLPKDKWLDYALNDVKALRDVLSASYGFPPENIKVL